MATPRKGQFKKGQSGNPKGRPVGSRNKTTLVIEELLNGGAEALTKKCIEKAKEGDTTAIRLCLERLYPPAKDRTVTFDLPPMETAADMVDALAAIVRAVSVGALTPSEGQAVANIVEMHRRTLEGENWERRLAALEKERQGSGSHAQH